MFLFSFCASFGCCKLLRLLYSLFTLYLQAACVREIKVEKSLHTVVETIPVWWT